MFVENAPTCPPTLHDAAEASTPHSPKAMQVFAELLNTVEAAASLRISKRSFQETVAAGKIGSYKFGRNIRFSVADLEAFKEANHRLPLGWKLKGKKGGAA